jgi:hypothetical protein
MWRPLRAGASTSKGLGGRVPRVTRESITHTVLGWPVAYSVSKPAVPSVTVPPQGVESGEAATTDDAVTPTWH